MDFSCILCKNSGFWVYQARRLLTLCWPLTYPSPLWQRTSHFQQGLSLTSFVLPVHNQGASPAPLSGSCPMVTIPAGYRLILFLITDCSSQSTFRRTSLFKMELFFTYAAISILSGLLMSLIILPASYSTSFVRSV